MKYFEANFTITPYDETVSDILTALLGEAGFEAFVPADNGFTAYVQQKFYDEGATQRIARSMPGHTVTYTVCEAPDEDWNQTWEAEGFEPIVLGQLVCVHDTGHPSPQACRYDIVINPRMAFGTGTHPTTRQILRQLCQMPLRGLRIVDAGCGTGVLGILAALRGAGHVFSYDIDSWSVENTVVNARLNGIETGMDVREGDAGVLPQTEDYDLLIANINRNILLADMPRFAKALHAEGRLLLSGFYEADAACLLEAAGHWGFGLERRTSEDGWTMLVMKRGKR